MKKGLTLTEVMVAVAVFAAIMMSAAGIFVSIRQSWQRQSADIDMVQNCRWAVEFMSKELRQAKSSSVELWPVGAGEDSIRFNSTADDKIRFFRGNGVLYTQDKLYREFNSGTPKELANLIIDNNGSVPVFNFSGGLATVTLTTGKDGKIYSMRTQVWPRN